MKTNMTIKNLLLVGIVSLTLASCGGGGGGGSSSGKGSSAHKPSTQHGLAPYNLSGCTMTYTYNGKPYTFTFGDSGEVNGVWENGSFTTNYDGSYTYSRSADGSSASLNMYTTSGTNSLGFSDSQTFNIKLAFSSTTQATARVDYVNKESYNGNALPNDKELEYTTTATFSGSGVLDNGFSEGESNDDTTSDDSTQLAPESLSVGSVINLVSDSGAKKSYTLTSASDCISESGSKLTWEYSCTGETTADFIARNALNLPSTYKLVFTTADSGSYTYFNSGGQSTLSGTFNLSDKADAPSQDDSDDDNSDIGEEDRTDGDDSDTPVVNETPVLITGMKIGNSSYYFRADGTCHAIFSATSTRKGVYSYTKSSTNPSEASLTIIWDTTFIKDGLSSHYETATDSFSINLEGTSSQIRYYEFEPVYPNAIFENYSLDSEYEKGELFIY